MADPDVALRRRLCRLRRWHRHPVCERQSVERAGAPKSAKQLQPHVMADRPWEFRFAAAPVERIVAERAGQDKIPDCLCAPMAVHTGNFERMREFMHDDAQRPVIAQRFRLVFEISEQIAPSDPESAAAVEPRAFHQEWIGADDQHRRPEARRGRRGRDRWRIGAAVPRAASPSHCRRVRCGAPHHRARSRALPVLPVVPLLSPQSGLIPQNQKLVSSAASNARRLEAAREPVLWRRRGTSEVSSRTRKGRRLTIHSRPMLVRNGRHRGSSWRFVKSGCQDGVSRRSRPSSSQSNARSTSLR
jgi:hypothetical protein